MVHPDPLFQRRALPVHMHLPDRHLMFCTRSGALLLLLLKYYSINFHPGCFFSCQYIQVLPNSWPQLHHGLSRAAKIDQWNNCACICFIIYTETHFNVKPFHLIQLFNPVSNQLFNQVRNEEHQFLIVTSAYYFWMFLIMNVQY